MSEPAAANPSIESNPSESSNTTTEVDDSTIVTPSVPETRYIDKIEYCPNCTMPPEYCEFSACYEEKCKPWLMKNHPELLLTQGTSNLTISDNNNKDNITSATTTTTTDTDNKTKKEKKPKKEKKAGEDEDDEEEDEDENEEEDTKKSSTKTALKKVAAPSQVVISKSQRSGRKFITTVSGLDSFEVDLKKASKAFAKKFASSASVVKKELGNGSEIAIQGDLSHDLADFITTEFKTVAKSNVYFVDKAGKKSKAF